ncbi:uncharacterized protein FOMMEDRAFT_16813 [Fomitiporia mediterranea MF3/22]|uniref:uncharacterized protein n=1 Tax=Fomitiporia mediterranea (strain MF3/22) TaxID=694068 RepID=UPI00044073FC|nr:uncharacterized protein FOMMEDRAFT_16813 [Fomitiporia mediterranea MF3/22]EJD08459.1 hypothetical protein FOMMEDRAFT_16813 [Fomitiporia mediterranea MF3/22]
MSYQKRMDHLTALPSVSYQLSSLPQAKSLDHVALHQPTLASHLPAQEAKLRKALSVTSQNSANSQQQTTAPKTHTVQNSPTCSQTPLMMRTTKSKLR